MDCLLQLDITFQVRDDLVIGLDSDGVVVLITLRMDVLRAVRVVVRDVWINFVFEESGVLDFGWRVFLKVVEGELLIDVRAWSLWVLLENDLFAVMRIVTTTEAAFSLVSSAGGCMNETERKKKAISTELSLELYL